MQSNYALRERVHSRLDEFEAQGDLEGALSYALSFQGDFVGLDLEERIANLRSALNR